VDSLCKALGRISDTRITIILPSGAVAGDTEEDPATMENHGSRPEVREALSSGSGMSIRYSNTLQRDLMYVAVPAYTDSRLVAVIRTSVPVASVTEMLGSMTRDIVILGLAVVILAGLVSWWVTRGISRPLQNLRDAAEDLAAGELSRTIPRSEIVEIDELAATMTKMARELDRRIETIRRQQGLQTAILTGMSEGIIAFNADEALVSMNQAAAKILDLEASAAGELTLPEAVRNTQLQRLVRDTLESGNPGQAIITLTDGAEKSVLVSTGALRIDQTGRPGVLAVLNDITEQSKLERIRRDFVANVSHELKTPITSIIGSIETLLDGAAERAEDREKFLAIIRKQANRLNSLVEDLLNLSQIEKMSIDGRVDMMDVSLAPVLESAAAACESAASSRHTTVTVQCPEDLVLRANSQLIEQAVINLVDNAIKYSEPGTRVEVSAERRGDKALIRVKDEGQGIPPKHLTRIFERFYRVDSSRSRELGGTGLGLSIVKHIALAHGGLVSVDSVRGEGSTFTIALPVGQLSRIA
jgi:two-component system phosphate regulon sensor histidine kinase PhoR